MVYEPKTWSDDTPRSATAFNHMETQYSDLKSILDAHNHDEDYYTRTSADTTFFHSEFMGQGSGFDADTLDEQHASGLAGEAFPIGTVLDWSGYEAGVPAGWVVCDGSGGTPDSRDKFIIGAGGAYTQGATGGSATLVPTAALTIATHVLTTAEIPSHPHTYYEYDNPTTSLIEDSSDVFPSSRTSTARTAGNQTAGGQAHGHTGSTITFDEVSTMPPYYALLQIMRVS